MNYKFKAKDLKTGKEIKFSIFDLLFLKDDLLKSLQNSLHEEMDFTLIR